MTQAVLEKTITLQSDSNDPAALLAAATEISKSKVKAAMSAGAVWLTRGKKTKRLRRAKAQLRAGDLLAIYYDEKILALEPEVPTLISDESIFSVWYKPAGLYSSGSKFGDHCAINRWIEQNCLPQKPAFMVHRLDRFATGLMVLAHTKQAAADLSRQFRARIVNKIYHVVVEGIVDTAQTIDEALDGKEAISIIKILKVNPELQQTLLEVDIKTGRKHQIRRHMAHIAHPVVGDRRYGKASEANGEANSSLDLQLTACELSFNHPQSGEPRHYLLDEALQPSL